MWRYNTTLKLEHFYKIWKQREGHILHIELQPGKGICTILGVMKILVQGEWKETKVQIYTKQKGITHFKLCTILALDVFINKSNIFMMIRKGGMLFLLFPLLIYFYQNYSFRPVWKMMNKNISKT